MQYMWVILDSFGQASEIKCPKLVTKNTRTFQKLSLLAVYLTESDSDSAEGTEGEDEVSASSVIYSTKNSQQPMPMPAKLINYEISLEIFSFLHLSHWINCLH